MSYTGMYRSNMVKVNRDTLTDLFGENFADQHHDIHFEDEETMFIGDTAGSTFDVWAGEWAGELPEEFEHMSGNITELWLELISEGLQEGEVLTIRSVGFEGLAHMPDAFEWTVKPDGTVQFEQLGM